jgi:hypothetical protein
MQATLIISLFIVLRLVIPAILLMALGEAIKRRYEHIR